MPYFLRNWLSILIGLTMRWLKISYRFPKDYRYGITAWNRIVYATICTFQSNIIADGGKVKLWKR